MSFFADMIAGGLAGAGKGMSDYAVMREREDDKRAQLEAQMQLKREMLADQLASKKELAEMRYGQGGSGSGGGSGAKGGSGSYFEQMMREAKTPEAQDSVIREARMRAGDDAAAALSEYYGRPMTKTVSEFDPAEAERMSRRDYAEANPNSEASKTVTKSVSYDKEKGAQALNRLIAMADAAKYDDYTKGETTATKLDAAKGAAVGKSPEEAAAIIQSYTGNTDQRVIDSREKMNQDRIDAKKTAGGGKPKAKDENDVSLEKALTNAVRAAGSNFRKPTTQETLDPAAAEKYNQAKQAHINSDSQVQALNEKLKRGTAPAAKTEKWARVDGKLVKVN